MNWLTGVDFRAKVKTLRLVMCRVLAKIIGNFSEVIEHIDFKDCWITQKGASCDDMEENLYCSQFAEDGRFSSSFRRNTSDVNVVADVSSVC